MLGRYELLHHLATGGMAEIWLARQHGVGGFQKLVVIKQILPHLSANADFVQMFLDEGRLAAQLSHPNIVQIFDLGQQGSDYFLAMEFVQGENLHFMQKRLAERQAMAMPVTYAAKVMSQACEALYYAHTKTDNQGRPLGLVHRDVSPPNLVLSYQGQVKIVDFGIAKAVTKIQSTRVGTIKGNYGYMSPEQASSRPLDHRSDIFSLGVVLWELVTGARLFDSDNDLALVKAICEQPTVSPRAVRRGIPEELERIVLKALEKDPNRRFQDCHEMHLALERFIHGQGSPVTPVHLARYVQSLFSDRIEAWKRVLSGEPDALSPEVVSQISTVFVSHTPDQGATDAAVGGPLSEPVHEETVQMRVPDALLQQLADEDSPDAAVNAVHFDEVVTAETAVPQTLLDSMSTAPGATEPWDEGATVNARPPAQAPSEPARKPKKAKKAPSRRAPTGPVLSAAAPAARLPADLPADGTGPIPDDDEEGEDRPLFPEMPIEALLGEADAPAAGSRGDPDEKLVAEVLFRQGDVILDAAVLRPFQAYRARKQPRIARMGPKSCTVKLPADARGVLRRARGAAENVEGPAKIVLDENDHIDVVHEGFDYRVRVYRPPAVPRSARSPLATKLWFSCIGIAIGLHLLIFVGFLLSDAVLNIHLPVANTQLAERYAELKTVKKKRVVHHRHHKKKHKIVKLRFRQKDPTEAKPQIPKRLERRIARITRRYRHVRGGDGGGTKSLLNALRSPVAGTGTTLKEVVSNIDAIKGKGRAPAGAFKVAGTLAALKGGKVNLALGGSQDVGTLGGKEVLGNGVGKLRGRRGSGHVRGRVSSVRALARVTGSLSREQVVKVINEHIGPIQACYERALNHNPGLAGKIEFEWTVRQSGRVATARERSSTMGNAQVSRCIIRVIRKMRFPRPKGGSVVIAYPFMFRSVPS